jgi:hypothetical protein
MKNILLSDHALEKIDLLKKHNVEIEKHLIENTVIYPDKTDRGYKGRFIAQKRLDDNHVLRVVYEEYTDSILVITLYPARRIRYEKD